MPGYQNTRWTRFRSPEKPGYPVVSPSPTSRIGEYLFVAGTRWVAPLLVERLMRQCGLILAAGRVRSKKTKRKINTKSRRTQSTPRNPQQPGDRDHLETACDETRPTRSPILACFRRSRVCGNQPHSALVISKTTNVTLTHRHTDRHTDRETDRLIK